MKRLVLSIIICLVALPSFAARRDTLRILAIGNSFSEDAVEDHLHPIAAEKGVTLIIGNMYIPGCKLERHAENVRDNKADYSYRKIEADGVKVKEGEWTLERAMADEKWDIVTLQQSSPISGQTDGYHLGRPHGRYLAACVWVEYLLGEKVKGVKYCPEGMTAEDCVLAQKAAHAAVRKPAKLTKIK